MWVPAAPPERPAPAPGAPQASPARTRAPGSSPARKLELPSRALANGLEVIVLEDHSVPLVNVELAVRNGAYTEPPELNGLSHLYEHMFFRSNRAHANQEDYLEQLGQLGINYNGTTEVERVNYFLITTTPNWHIALRMLRDSALYPLFDSDELEREREVVISEIHRQESNPYGALNRAMHDRLFYKYPSRKNPLGSRRMVASATPALLRTIQQRYYVPNNSALFITGDVQPEEAFRLAEELFGQWPRAENPFETYPLVEHPPLGRSEGSLMLQPVEGALIEIGWQGPSVGKDDAATYAADVFSFILRQPNSRFQRALVDSGLATVANIGYLTQRNVGPITILLLTTPEKARAALEALYKEIAQFHRPDYFTDEQLANAKTLLEAEDLFDREKTSEFTHTLSFWWASTGLDYYRGYLENLRRTTRADIRRYVETYVQGKPRVAVALLSSEIQKQIQLKPEELVGP